MNNAYTQFIDELIKRRDFPDGLMSGAREEVKRELMERLDYFLMDHLIDALSDEDAAVFVNMLEKKKSMEEIQQFPKEPMDNYRPFIRSTFQKFATDYLF